MMAGIEKVKYDGVEVLDRVQGPRFNTFNKKTSVPQRYPQVWRYKFQSTT
jgi:hypothetical protein